MFAVEFGIFIYFATQSRGDFHRPINGRLVWYRQSARVSETGFTNVGVGRIAIRIVGARTKHFALGFELHMDFEADNCGIFGHNYH